MIIKIQQLYELFDEYYSVLRDAYGYDNWPTGRGIFFSHNKKFLVWVNEEDHLRIISMQQGGDLAEVWTRLVKVEIYFKSTDESLFKLSDV